MNVLLTYYKLKDDWEDGKSPVSLAGKNLLSGKYKKIYGRYPEKCRFMEERLKHLLRLEKNKCKNIDEAADEFARIMSCIFSFGIYAGDEKYGRILEDIGYNLGRWIYIIDACDDFENDIKKSKYNPFAECYGKVLSKDIRRKIYDDLMFNLNRLSNAMDLLEFKANQNIIYNILYEGLYSKTVNIVLQPKRSGK